jgi:arsenical pump membrane protein
MLAGAGLAGAGTALVTRPDYARASALQDYPAFVLVAGLLLIGLVADDEGLFAAAGDRLGRIARRPVWLFGGAVILVGLVTATLNLDTSVAFLTPVLVYAGRSRAGEEAMLYGCLMLSNAGSLLLPGANLTNLILLGHQHLAGGRFLARMWLAALAALVVTAVVVGVMQRRSLRAPVNERELVGRYREGAEGPANAAPLAWTGASLGQPDQPAPTRIGRVLGLTAISVGTLLVLLLPDPALPVLGVGVVAAGIHLGRRRATLAEAGQVLGLPLLIGLLGIAVALGTLGRAWSGPATLLAHLDEAGAAALAAASTVVVNNLPAASLLAARAPDHLLAVLVGLNVGPNLCVTGSLAWLLWLRAAKRAGATPSLAKASMIGLVAVPLSMAAALAGLAVTGTR